MTNAVILGGGNETGMAYYGAAGTALPTYPLETPGAGWNDAGKVAEAGITWTPLGDTTVIRDWSKAAVRQIANTPGHIQAPIITTTEDSFKAIFGAGNVVVTPATSTHGKLISVTPESMGAAQAYMFIGRDGDDTFLLGTTSGVVTAMGDITFNKDGAVTWQPTIEGNWTFIKDDGQASS